MNDAQVRDERTNEPLLQLLHFLSLDVPLLHISDKYPDVSFYSFPLICLFYLTIASHHLHTSKTPLEIYYWRLKNHKLHINQLPSRMSLSNISLYLWTESVDIILFESSCSEIFDIFHPLPFPLLSSLPVTSSSQLLPLPHLFSPLKSMSTEIEIMKRIRHRHIVSMYELYETPKCLWIILELVNRCVYSHSKVCSIHLISCYYS